MRPVLSAQPKSELDPLSGPLSSVPDLSAGLTHRPCPQRYAGRGPSDARGVRIGRWPAPARGAVEPRFLWPLSSASLAAVSHEPALAAVGSELWPLFSDLTSAPESPAAPSPNDTPDGDRPTLEGSGLGGDPRLIAVPVGTRFLGHCPRHLTLAPDSPSAPAPSDAPDGDRSTLEGAGLGSGPRLNAVLLSPALCGHRLLRHSPPPICVPGQMLLRHEELLGRDVLRALLV